LTFEYGAFFIWGDNENGQLGDKKRRFLESPYPKAKFERRHNVENVVCGIDSCGVIVEDLDGILPKRKTKKQPKRTIPQSDMITSGEHLKRMSEA
jgi:alpha-tubulin suppressor-like RCC1 family protein